MEMFSNGAIKFQLKLRVYSVQYIQCIHYIHCIQDKSAQLQLLLPLLPEY